jgi:hypothetical protein
MTTGEEAEHANLLRKATRTKLLLLTVALVLTWALWTTLQGGDQAAEELDQKYDASLKDLENKWKIPLSSPVEYSTEAGILEYLSRHLGIPQQEYRNPSLGQGFRQG